MTSPLFVCRHVLTSLALGCAALASAAQAPARPALAPTAEQADTTSSTNTADADADAAAEAPAVSSSAAVAAATLRPSADGTAIIDQRSRLAWARCVEGMVWNGNTCAGQRKLFDRAEASTIAETRAKTEKVRWRLPRANELRRLVDKKANPPGIPAQLFPAAPASLHWTSTANIKNFSNNQYNYTNVTQGNAGVTGSRLAALDGWAVDMDTGIASGDIPRSTKLPVRLVRMATEHD